MKQFIVLIAVLPLMLLFISQYALDQRNQAVTTYIQNEVLAACEEARTEGYFSEKIRMGLRSNIASTLGIAANDIQIDATDTVQYRINYFDPTERRGMITYTIKVPIGELVAGKNLLRIQTDTMGMYTISGTLASERLP